MYYLVIYTVSKLSVRGEEVNNSFDESSENSFLILYFIDYEI